MEGSKGVCGGVVDFSGVPGLWGSAPKRRLNHFVHVLVIPGDFGALFALGSSLQARVLFINSGQRWSEVVRGN
ncbi:hypothetical protein IF2G_01914 [Cordyceps javanica]|nr:hypothetical protein IF2G_01914 [Cordyceps javanica]